MAINNYGPFSSRDQSVFLQRDWPGRGRLETTASFISVGRHVEGREEVEQLWGGGNGGMNNAILPPSPLPARYYQYMEILQGCIFLKFWDEILRIHSEKKLLIKSSVAA